MADGSWDNSGHGVPAKAGLPLWGKIALGCGIAFLVVVVTCVGGVAYLGNRYKKDPKGFERGAMAFALDKMNIRPDWEDFRAVVEQLRTPEGCQALYAANPALAKSWPSEAAFLEASSRWHKEVVSATRSHAGLDGAPWPPHQQRLGRQGGDRLEPEERTGRLRHLREGPEARRSGTQAHPRVGCPLALPH
ncbi:MAG: hypothetical protein IPI84_11600 [Holophagaceae bacterium]|nr:hypothetical protein [Holophagaceae bacterium]